MLKSISIQNFRSCTLTELDDLQPGVTAIIGRNGVGKTNLLLGISILAKRAIWGVNTQYLRDDDWFESVQLCGKARISVDQFDFVYETSAAGKESKNFSKPDEIMAHFDERISVSNASSGEEQYLATRRGSTLEVRNIKDPQQSLGPLKTGPGMTCLSAILAFLPWENAAVSAFRSLYHYLDSVLYYETRDIGLGSRPISSDDYTEWSKRYEAGIDSSGSVLSRLLYLSQNRPEVFAELVDLLGDNGLGLVSEIKVDELYLASPSDSGRKGPEIRNADYYAIRFVPSSGVAGGGQQILIPFEHLSEGTRRIIRLLTVLLMDSSSLLLIEQPEDSLHSHLLQKVLDILIQYSLDVQVILTTHSPDVLDYLAPEQVRVAFWEDRSTHIRSLGDKELEAAREYLSEEGALSDFLDSLG